MGRIKFQAEVEVSEIVNQGVDLDYYVWELDADNVYTEVSSPYVYAMMDFTIDFDEEAITEEDMWFKICGEFDRPSRIDGGSEF